MLFNFILFKKLKELLGRYELEIISHTHFEFILIELIKSNTYYMNKYGSCVFFKL